MESQFKKFAAKLDRDVEDLGSGDDFAEAAGSLARDVNTLLILAMAIGQSEEKGEINSAPAIVQACKDVLAATDATGAAMATKQLQAAIAAPASGGETKWEKAASLAPLMTKTLPSLTTEIKRLSRNQNTLTRGDNAAKVAGDAATLAVIAYGCRVNVSETNAPTEEKLWKEYCDRLCGASLKLNDSVTSLREKKGSFEDFSAALQEVEATCNTTCHEKFSATK